MVYLIHLKSHTGELVKTIRTKTPTRVLKLWKRTYPSYNTYKMLEILNLEQSVKGFAVKELIDATEVQD